MGLLTILKKMKQKEKEIRLLMLYPLVKKKSKEKASLFVWNLLNFWFHSKYGYIMI